VNDAPRCAFPPRRRSAAAARRAAGRGCAALPAVRESMAIGAQPMGRGGGYKLPGVLAAPPESAGGRLNASQAGRSMPTRHPSKAKSLSASLWRGGLALPDCRPVFVRGAELSTAAIRWAKEIRIPKNPGGSVVAMKAALMCLAWHADDAGKNSHPSIATIERWSGLSRRAVVSALQALEMRELVKVAREHGRVNRYSLPLGDWCTPCTSAPPALVHEVPSTSAPPASDWCTSCTQTVINNLNKRESPENGNLVSNRRPTIDELDLPF
jgi:hypothetical protein